MKKVFLGGTCNGSTWRDELIKQLKIDYYNPIVDNWTIEHQKEELKQRKICDFCLYVITPKMTGVYSIAEAIDDSNKRPDKTLFCILDEDNGILFTNSQRKSLAMVEQMIKNNKSKTFVSLYSIAKYLNTFIKLY